MQILRRPQKAPKDVNLSHFSKQHPHIVSAAASQARCVRLSIKTAAGARSQNHTDLWKILPNLVALSIGTCWQKILSPVALLPLGAQLRELDLKGIEFLNSPRWLVEQEDLRMGDIEHMSVAYPNLELLHFEMSLSQIVTQDYASLILI